MCSLLHVHGQDRTHTLRECVLTDEMEHTHQDGMPGTRFRVFPVWKKRKCPEGIYGKRNENCGKNKRRTDITVTVSIAIFLFVGFL